MLLILLVVGAVGFLQGVGVGVVIAIVLFAVNYGRINMVKNTLSGVNYQSNVARSASLRRLLQERGEQLHILKLQGFLFFGTANNLLEHIRQRMNDRTRLPVRFIVLDFRLVTGLDSSAVFSFAKLKQMAEAQYFVLVFTHLSSEFRRQLSFGGYHEEPSASFCIFPDLDHGVEWCENKILAVEHIELAQSVPLVQQLQDILPATVFAPSLMVYLEQRQIPAGEYLIRPGDAADELCLIESGQLTVLLEMSEGQKVRLRMMGPGTMIGEIGFYLDTPRIASVVAEQPSVVYRVTKSALQEMRRHDPDIAAVFHEFVAKTLAERLAHMNTAIAALLQ